MSDSQLKDFSPLRQPFTVEVWHHVNLPVPASRLSKTRVYGYLLVIRPVCGNAISQPGCAACLQRGPPSFGPFKKTCCRRDSVTTACVALFQSPANSLPPPPVLCRAMCLALALLETGRRHCLPSILMHALSAVVI